MAIYGSLGEVNIGALSATIADTATDVFVYDTRKDSDGGAWRKRTQHTSWYNETLNTATRGSRKDFPATAVIVSEQEKLTIYDGDDPDMPMWMVFQGVTGSWKFIQYGDDSAVMSVYALNGTLCVGNNGTTYASLHILNFIKETAYLYIPSLFQFGGNFVNRNDLGGPLTQVIGAPSIVDRKINDVAMTVLPNAPIDAATGLPVPTIAVATLGGLSIIKDDGTVINGTSTSGSNYSNTIQVTITEEGYLWWLADYNNAYSPLRDSYALSLNTIPSSNFTWDNGSDNLSTGLYYAVTTGNEAGEIKIGPVNTWAWTKQQRNALGGSAGLAIHKPNIGAESNSLIVGITSSYNTGWMHGDIKGAWLSDTSTASVTGTELITNGDGTNTTGWTAGNSGAGHNTLIATGGNFKCTTNISDGAYFGQGISVVSGKTYVMQATIVSDGTSKSTRMYLGPNVGSAGYAINQEGNVLGGVVTIFWTATFTGTAYLWFYGSAPTAGTYILVDNVSARLAEPDRSVNARGLAVYGTITKSSVATGSNLVSYSGFGASNGLIQPYNSAFDFGTGDYYMSIWAYGGSADQALMIREEPQGDANAAILIFQYNGYYAFYSRTNGTSTWTSFLSTAPYGNYWSHIYLVRRSGTLQGYVNGNLVGSVAFSGSVSNTNAQLSIGKRIPGVNTQYFTGQLALAKIGAGAPSPEQILKIYNDEKALFQENSQCTLYGSSDAVTALAYDDSTRLLYAGTSSGRSDFQGLERINNTTTAVTTAISASNGLIAEQ